MKTSIMALLAVIPAVLQASEPLIVVQDLGGESALPYYEALNLQPRNVDVLPPNIMVPQAPATPASEANMLPVRSTRLTPGKVNRRAIDAPGLRPFFIVGDDEASQAWLRRYAERLRELGAVGLVINVETEDTLNHLRTLAPGLLLSPVPGDDLAERLGLRHYPALITSTGIEQ